MKCACAGWVADGREMSWELKLKASRFKRRFFFSSFFPFLFLFSEPAKATICDYCGVAKETIIISSDDFSNMEFRILFKMMIKK
jgi:hypothetical protein